MAKMNLQWYQNKDQYSDGDIEEKILSYVKESNAGEQSSLDELTTQENWYPVLYHLSELRENILNWYPFQKNARALEVGSGCGALTGMLCRKAGTVVSADLSRRRATINFKRHKAYDNLEIAVGNLNDMEFPELFDYVVVNGVLEYAMSFTEGAKPYHTFLNNLKRFLKPGGHMLIAIENRLGLKYFNGAPEDHTNKYFDGIEGYQNNEFVRTFSKQELTDLLKECGLPEQRFYYPYPDYKFPKEIFTDETILQYGYGKPFVNLEENRVRLFEERGVWKSLSKEKATAVFANSFLVDAAAESKEFGEERAVLYAKLNNDRDSRFRIATTIERVRNQKIVRKAPLTEDAKTHIAALEKNTTLAEGQLFRNLKGSREAEGIVYPFVEGESLDGEIARLIEAEQTDRIVGVLHEVFDEYGKEAKTTAAYWTAEFQKVFGTERLAGIKDNTAFESSTAEAETEEKPIGKKDAARELPCICPANIDLICNNIFRDGKQFQIIDCEWVFDMPIPVPFIIWRSVNELYANHPSLSSLIAYDKLMKEFHIDPVMGQVFRRWTIHFEKEYVGNDPLAKYEKPVSELQIEALPQKKYSLSSSLYVDTGNGFSEEQKLYSETKIENDHTDKTLADGSAYTFSVTYDLQGFQNIKQLRWDPLEGDASICRITHITGASATAFNACEELEEGQMFATTDPIYLLQADGTGNSITIEGTVRRLNAEELAARLSEYNVFWRKREKEEEQHAAQYLAEKTDLENRLQELRQSYELVLAELEGIHNSKSWKIMNKLHEIVK